VAELAGGVIIFIPHKLFILMNIYLTLETDLA